MQYGLNCPNDVDPRVLAELAHEAEGSGWDGVFVWDTILGHDPWVTLSAMAMRTERARIGPLVTPVARRDPWKLACETITLDQLSNGRLILPIGLGVAEDEKWDQLGLTAEMDRRVRAKMLDEGLAALTGLWGGRPFSFAGDYYHLDQVTLGETPVQSPRIPIWVIGGWPDPPKSKLRRMLRWDGVLVGTDVDVRAMKDYVRELRSATTPFDVAMEGETPGDDPAKAASIVLPHAEAGVTWWIEAIWDTPRSQGGIDGMRKRIRQGPPRV